MHVEGVPVVNGMMTVEYVVSLVDTVAKGWQPGTRGRGGRRACAGIGTDRGAHVYG